MNETERSTISPGSGPPAADTGQESVVLLLQGSSAKDHPGIVDGYDQLRARGQVRNLAVFPVFGRQGVERGEAFWRAVVSTACDTSATLVVFHHYHSDQLPDPRSWIQELRQLPSAPMIVSTLGDPFMNGFAGRPSVPRSFLAAASASDLVTLTSMGILSEYVARHTDAPLLLMPLGACQVRFGRALLATSPADAEFDLAFVGSRNRSRNPGKGYYWLGRRRERLVERLTKRYGRRFAVFGKGWDDLASAQGPVPFDEQVSAVRRARVVVGGVPFSRARYYASNRPFIQATSAVPIVDVSVPGVETLLRDRVHWVLTEERSLLNQVDEVLGWGDEELHRLGRSAAEYVLHRHTQAHRVAAVVENVRRRRLIRMGDSGVLPHLPFLLDDVDPSREAQLATRNWG